MDELKHIIAKNLIYYRTQAKLTQLELANTLNYSDKSISKWEHGAGLPDIMVLKQLADLYGIKVDDFFVENEFSTPKRAPKQIKKINHFFITTLSVLLVWFIASIVFVTLLWLKVPKSWLAFITAIPVNMIVLIVLSRIWYSLPAVGVFASLFIWSLALTIYLFTITTHSYYLFILCIPLQTLIIVWFIFRESAKKRKKQNQ